MSTQITAAQIVEFLTNEAYDFLGEYDREKIKQIAERIDVKRDTLDRDLDLQMELQTDAGWLLMLTRDLVIQAESDLKRTHARLLDSYAQKYDSYTTAGNVKPASMDKLRIAIEGDEDYILAREDYERKELVAEFADNLKWALKARDSTASNIRGGERART